MGKHSAETKEATVPPNVDRLLQDVNAFVSPSTSLQKSTTQYFLHKEEVVEYVAESLLKANATQLTMTIRRGLYGDFSVSCVTSESSVHDQLKY